METLHNNGLCGTVHAVDIMNLLSPSTLSIGLLSHLLFDQFPNDHSLVTVVDEGVMAAIYSRKWDEAYSDRDSVAHPGLCTLLDNMWKKEWIVFPFMTGSHFHGILVNYFREDIGTSRDIRGSINYIDSFLSEDPQHAHLIRDFLTWTYDRCVPSIAQGQWTINVKTTGTMIRQHMYLAPGQHRLCFVFLLHNNTDYRRWSAGRHLAGRSSPVASYTRLAPGYQTTTTPYVVLVCRCVNASFA